jgi:hypothetical protein
VTYGNLRLQKIWNVRQLGWRTNRAFFVSGDQFHVIKPVCGEICTPSLDVDKCVDVYAKCVRQDTYCKKTNTSWGRLTLYTAASQSNLMQGLHCHPRSFGRICFWFMRTTCRIFVVFSPDKVRSLTEWRNTPGIGLDGGSMEVELSSVIVFALYR